MKIASNLLTSFVLCVSFSLPALASNPNVYVVDFTTRNQEKNATTQKFTYDFELALSQVGCFNVLEASNYQRLLSEIDRERAIMDLAGLSDSAVQNLKTEKVDMVVFGEVYDDVDSGQVNITVTFQRLDRTKHLIKATLLSRGKVNDAPSRQKAMQELANGLCKRTASVHRVTTNGFIFDLQECTMVERKLSCRLLVTNNDEDRDLYVSTHDSSSSKTRGQETIAYDEASNEYPANLVRLSGKQSEYSVESLLVSGRPAPLELFFDGVSSSTTLVSLLDIECWESEHQVKFTAKLRNIPIKK